GAFWTRKTLVCVGSDEGSWHMGPKPTWPLATRSFAQNVTRAEGIVKARVESIHRQRRLSATRPSVPAHRAVGYPGEAGSRPRKPDRPKLNPSLCRQGGVQRERTRSPARRSLGHPPT